jgi:hypothetical protein
MSEFTTTIDLGELGEQECSVEFDFFPAERTTRDDPGCPASVEITAVTWRGIDIKADCCMDLIDQLEVEAFGAIDAQRDSDLADRAEYLHEMREAA